MGTRLKGIARTLVPGIAVVMPLLSCTSSRDAAWVELNPAPAASGETLHIKGTVRHLDLEGGLFVIRDAAGTQYDPTNLPESFRKDGMSVEAEARRRDDLVSIGMVGPIVELVRIRQLRAN